MLKGFKTEINPTLKQKIKIHQTIGVCRYIYNFYIAHNKELYEKDQKFMDANAFSVWLNNEYLPENPDKSWIKDVSSKARKQAMVDANNAFERFFKGQSNFPRFKKKHVSDVKMYFVRNSKTDCLCERHRIKIPTLGWVRIKEKGYIPVSKDGWIIKSGRVSMKAGRYFVSVIVDVPSVQMANNTKEPLGVDLGLKEFAVLSNGNFYANINKTKRVRQLEKQIKREQRSLARKYENAKKGGVTQYKNIQKQKVRIQKLYYTLTNIRTDYINKIISEIVKTKPSHISVEDLNVKGMMKNKHLSKAIASQKFNEFRTKLTFKCKENEIELRIVDRWYASSKICHRCGNQKKDLKLSERVYKCDVCGYEADRDYNASLNLRDAEKYVLAF